VSNPFRPAIKGVVEALLGSDFAMAAGQVRRRGERLVLAYHNVIDAAQPPAVGEAALHLPLGLFTAQMDAILVAELDIVPIDAPMPGPRDRPQIAVTFDDAYADSLEFAVPVLAERGIPATIFVSPGLLGDESTWWDRLAKGTPPAVDHQTRESALWDFGGDTARILESAPSRGWPIGPVAREQRIGTEAEVGHALARHEGLSVAPHTMTHPNLKDLASALVRSEITQSLSWLRERWPGRTQPWLAYPYGMASPETRSEAVAAGYAGAMALSGSWHVASVDRFAIPRLNVTPGLSSMGFRTRLAGIF
jgi:peptidoglycan/xylan/chitin deacetylase (PgdA/CDA1 family)